MHCLSSLDRNYIEYSGSSCKQTTSGHEKGVSKWSWPLARMVLWVATWGVWVRWPLMGVWSATNKNWEWKSCLSVFGYTFVVTWESGFRGLVLRLLLFWQWWNLVTGIIFKWSFEVKPHVYLWNVSKLKETDLNSLWRTVLCSWFIKMLDSKETEISFWLKSQNLTRIILCCS